MCLEIIGKRSTKPKKAKQDIVCYKVLNYTLEDGIHFKSLYQGMEVVLGTEYKERSGIKIFESNSNCDDMPENELLFELGRGVFHSFEFADDAVTDMYGEATDGIVVKCIIPKGSEYFVGNFYGMPSFGSRDIIYTDTIVDCTDSFDGRITYKEFNALVSAMKKDGMTFELSDTLKERVL